MDQTEMPNELSISEAIDRGLLIRADYVLDSLPSLDILTDEKGEPGDET